LSFDVDLSEYFKEIELLYVGFSGSAEGSTELQQIMNWSFESFQFLVFNQTQNKNPTFHHVGYQYEDIPASNSTRKSHGKRFMIGFCVAIVGPAFFFVLLLVLGYVSFRKWSSLKKLKKNESSIGCPKEFSYKELKFATKGFHGSRIIGNGSFGTVYKALFVSSGTVAAVKRSRHSHEGKTEFLSELSIIAGLRHKNLVQLLGWCVEKGELLLVYEFMVNGSLDKLLYKEFECGILLSWIQRVNIVAGLASVLAYLHQECEQRVIHRDIKTANILLDGNLNPRLGDFGLAKLMDHDMSPVSTLTAGTMGYLAPEYLQYGKATDKTDVFSFGVVVLEVACGRRPIEKEGQEMVNLVDFVWGLYSQGKLIEAVDKRLNGEFDEDEMKKMLLLGLSCAHPNSDERPSMRRVLQILNNEALPLVVPKVKPCLSFSSGLLLSFDEIVSDFDERFSSINQYSCKIQIEPSC
jgi:serine/threonine protein kinase